MSVFWLVIYLQTPEGLEFQVEQRLLFLRNCRENKVRPRPVFSKWNTEWCNVTLCKPPEFHNDCVFTVANVGYLWECYFNRNLTLWRFWVFFYQWCFGCIPFSRLRVVCTFGDSGEIDARAHAKMGSNEETCEEETHYKGRCQKLGLPLWHISSKEHNFARLHVFYWNRQN